MGPGERKLGSGRCRFSAAHFCRRRLKNVLGEPSVVELSHLERKDMHCDASSFPVAECRPQA